MTWHPQIPRGLPKPRLALVGVAQSLMKRTAAASVQAMDVVILQLREQKRDVEADALTNVRDEWARHVAAAVEATT